jgi:hypothetical protein
MISKKVREKTKREQHKAQLINSKARNRKVPILGRHEAKKTQNPTILIVCEGRNTEPSYFRQFRLYLATIKVIGHGYNTVSLVNQTIELQQQGSYDQVWCVFDKDQNTDTQFNQAIEICKAKRFGVAYSNQAFEYWLILHFEDHQGGAMDRRDYNAKINSYINTIGFSYDGEKSKQVSTEFFELMLALDHQTRKSRVKLAIERARRNYDYFDHRNPASEESSTTVFRLVEELLNYI